ncbi:MAG: hypothetical protein FNT15_02770 [Sulfurovum sp.]|nr:MAG: hypothetical protein FNT15_02770 [Sulfurovum sp.]
MINKKLFAILAPLYIVAIFFTASQLPIGGHEAEIFFKDSGLLGILSHLFEGFFHNGLDFRLPFVLFGFSTLYLFFILSSFYFDSIEERLTSVSIFALLAGVITSSILVNISPLVMSLVLLFVIGYKRNNLWLQYSSMLLILFVHDASIIFFLAVMIAGVFKKNKELFFVALLGGIVTALYLNGLDVGDKPKGKILELLGLYIAVFSPFVFIYFVFSIYHIGIKKRQDILWFICSVAFIFSILLSIRQKIIMTDFAPYVVVGVMIMLKDYYDMVYVRLHIFRKPYIIGYSVVIATLILSSLVIFLHRPIFFLLSDKSKHFAYPFYKPYWIAQKVPKCYTTDKSKEKYQLKYYGIKSCKDKNVTKIDM